MKIPFKVSARTARLIGRENVATSKGAIIELVKNSYDADSPITIVFFDNYYSEIKESISNEEYLELIATGVPEQLLNKVYIRDGELYAKQDSIDEDEKKLLKMLSKKTVLYIIDLGEGMTQDVIINNWMTIGTDNKAVQYRSNKGRIKTGAKGIGRFALDKLGGTCEMITLFDKTVKRDMDVDGNVTDYTGYRWNVNWSSFEVDSATIDTINADLVGLKSNSLGDFLHIAHAPNSLINLLDHQDLSHGTILKISELRDDWSDYYVNQVFSDMEVLVPPEESDDFKIFLYSSSKPTEYGEILSYICDDYDYKIVARASENQKVKITVYRNENDIDLLPKDLWNRKAFQIEPYTENDFRAGCWNKEYTFGELLPGMSVVDTTDSFRDIGPFQFTFYYLKRSYDSFDAKRFFYKQINASLRKEWLDKFGGIKLFRDSFRVRPYGEKNDSAFDWLGLGARKSKNPAGIAKKGGGYKVEVENVAGAIKISRLTNVNFEDKSSREGLQENKTFKIFRQLLNAIISVFEKDRAYIAYEMALYDDEKYGHIRDKEKAEALAKRIVEESRKKTESQSKTDNPSDGESDDKAQLAMMAELNQQKNEEIEQLREEQRILRSLASSGIVIASFSHDLTKINEHLGGRYDKLYNLLASKLQPSVYDEIEDRKNPFAVISRYRKEDIKLQNWLNYSLNTIKKDKRKRSNINLSTYFTSLKKEWGENFNDRAIEFDISKVEKVVVRAFEIDLDSIMHNLIVNSIEAFILLKEDRKRRIEVKVHPTDSSIIIEYGDNGPGLSADITNPEDIFKPLFTTKRSAETGEEIGTGLGMWLVNTIVKEYDGDVKLLYPNIGFGIRIIIPQKYK